MLLHSTISTPHFEISNTGHTHIQSHTQTEETYTTANQNVLQDSDFPG